MADIESWSLNGMQDIDEKIFGGTETISFTGTFDLDSFWQSFNDWSGIEAIIHPGVADLSFLKVGDNGALDLGSGVKIDMVITKINNDGSINVTML